MKMKFNLGDVVVNLGPIKIVGLTKSVYMVRSGAKTYPYPIDRKTLESSTILCGDCNSCPVKEQGPRCKYFKKEFCPLK